MTDAREGMEKHWDEMDRRERMQKSGGNDDFERRGQSHLKTSPDVVESDGFDALVDALGTMTGHVLARYPLSILWVLASILLGFGTGYLLSWIGAGLGSLVIGWLILRMIRNS